MKKNLLLQPKWKQRTHDTHIKHLEQYQESQTHPKKIRFAFLGDSMMERWLTTGNEYWNEMFSAEQNSLLQSANLGVGGDGIEHLLYRLNGDKDKNIPGILDNILVETIFLMIGTNNIEKKTVSDVFDAIVNIIQFIFQKQPHTKLVLFGVTYRKDVKKEKIVELNQKLLSFVITCDKLPTPTQITFADINTLLDLDTDYDDHVHLNTSGYLKWRIFLKNNYLSS